MKKISLKLTTKDITFIGVLLSVMLIFAFVPITIGTVGLAFMALIPVIVAAQVKGLKLGIIMGFFFGIFSLINAFTKPILINPLFQNPMVSIFPRIIIGIAVYFSLKLTDFLAQKINIKNQKVKNTIGYTVSSIVGTVTNTVLVLSMLLIFNYGKSVNGIVINWPLIGGIISTNFIIELILTAIICPPVSLAVCALYRVKSLHKSSASKENNEQSVFSEEKTEPKEQTEKINETEKTE